MRGVIFIGIMSMLASAIRAETALDAIKQLPKDQIARLARIEGREGTPDPKRWYILVQDPAAENGVHEYVVSNGTVVASRELSQFAESLTPRDLLGSGPLKVDSDQAAKLADEYAETNGVTVSTLNYELKKSGTDGSAAWNISCLDEKGNQVGELVVAAEGGNVLSHDGFAREPVAEATPEITPRKKPHLEAETRHKVAPPTPIATGPPETETAVVEPSPSPKKSPGMIDKTFNTVSHTLHKILPF